MGLDWVKLISEVVIPLLGIVITAYLVPWIRAKRQTELAQNCVRAAEQIFGGGKGTEKYAYAEELLIKAGVAETDAKRLIDAAVYEMNAFRKALEGGTDE